MKRSPLRAAALLAPLLALSGCATDGSTLNQVLGMGTQILGGGASTTGELNVAAGIKEALAIGSERAASSLAKSGGYSANPLVRIALPDSVEPMAKTLRQFGMGKYVDQLETDMNEAAELAATKAVPIFKTAVTGMTLNDAMGILKGADNSATTYFRGKTENSLRGAFAPVIQNSLKQTGYYDSYKQMLGAYEKLPLASKPPLDLEKHVLDKSLDGLFLRLGEEERAIRKDPAKRTTDLLKQVFGGDSSNGGKKKG